MEDGSGAGRASDGRRRRPGRAVPDAVIERLGLAAHPEGGWYRETWRDAPAAGGRGAGTAIYYLLCEGERSHWHRVDATEVWHHYAGDPLELLTSADGVEVNRQALGSDLAAGERPQVVVPPNTWQAARPLGPWTLAGCTVSPAFEFAGFELAPHSWEPGA
ncbi:MAG TPA: cupin domain-containing protein [Acidimicrobiales bacterium]|nr:cupin domain-containing protein [Acidimicrobiales bacterium]